MLGIVKNLINDESGQGMVEYGLVLGFIAAGAMTLILAARYSVQDLIIGVTTRLSGRIVNFPFS